MAKKLLKNGYWPLWPANDGSELKTHSLIDEATRNEAAALRTKYFYIPGDKRKARVMTRRQCSIFKAQKKREKMKQFLILIPIEPLSQTIIIDYHRVSFDNFSLIQSIRQQNETKVISRHQFPGITTSLTVQINSDIYSQLKHEMKQ